MLLCKRRIGLRRLFFSCLGNNIQVGDPERYSGGKIENMERLRVGEVGKDDDQPVSIGGLETSGDSTGQPASVEDLLRRCKFSYVNPGITSRSFPPRHVPDEHEVIFVFPSDVTPQRGHSRRGRIALPHANAPPQTDKVDEETKRRPVLFEIEKECKTKGQELVDLFGYLTWRAKNPTARPASHPIGILGQREGVTRRFGGLDVLPFVTDDDRLILRWVDQSTRLRRGIRVAVRA